MKTAKYYVEVAKTGFAGLEEIIETAMVNSYNQCLDDLIADDLLPDKERNNIKYRKHVSDKD